MTQGTLRGSDLMNADTYIARYSMKLHPEGISYAETYRSAGLIPAEALPGFSEARTYSCTVASGFDFADFELAGRAGLRTRYPSLEKEIHTFTNPQGITQ